MKLLSRIPLSATCTRTSRQYLHLFRGPPPGQPPSSSRAWPSHEFRRLGSRSLRSNVRSNVNTTSRKIGILREPSVSRQRSFSTVTPVAEKKVTVLELVKKYKENVPLTMVTAYDYTGASLVDKSGIDMILVGDSLGPVMLGYSNTTPVTMDEVVHHCKAVARGAKRAFLVGDMPFGSYEVSAGEAVRNAMRLIKEGNMEAVKMEGGTRLAPIVAAVSATGVPVIGHIGLTPQSIHALGGHKVQAKTAAAAQRLLQDALDLQNAGAIAIVIEAVPEPVATHITASLRIPTIGIGAGAGTSGQVLVYHDMLGLYSNFVPKFVKQYAQLGAAVQSAMQQYKQEVEQRRFPLSGVHTYPMSADEFAKAFPEAAAARQAQTQQPQPATLLQPAPPPSLPAAAAAAAAAAAPEATTPTAPAAAPPAAAGNVGVPIARHAAALPVAPPSSGGAADRQASQQQRQPTPSFEAENIRQRWPLTPSAVPVRRPTVAIIGGGAMGSLVGGKLAASGENNVWLVSSWAEHVRKINRDGLTLRNLDKSFWHVNINATTDEEEVLRTAGPADVALVLVKSPATRLAAQRAKKLLAPDRGIVLTLQNGLGNREIITEVVGDESRVFQGVTSQASFIESLGCVFHAGAGATSIANQAYRSTELDQLVRMFVDAGIDTELVDDLDSMLWGKLVVNAGINPLSALFRVKNGMLAQKTEYTDALKNVVGEAVSVASAKGIKLPFADPLQKVLQVVAATRDNLSSMLVDVIRGTRTEVSAINGVIVSEGQRLQVPVSYNQYIVELMNLPRVPHLQQLRI